MHLQGAPPWRVLARIVYASSHATRTLFHPHQPLFLRVTPQFPLSVLHLAPLFSRVFSLSLSLSLFIFALPRSTLRPKRGESSPPSPPTFARQPPPSFSPSPPKTAPFSQLVSPFFTLLPTLDTRFHPPPTNTRLSSSLSLFHPLLLSCPRLPLVLATLLLMSLFALLHSGKTLPYPKNNPFRAVHIARSIPYVYLQEEAYTPRNPAEQPTQTDLPLFVVLLRHLHRLPHPSVPRSSTSLASLL